jgi:hypothetical protein
LDGFASSPPPHRTKPCPKPSTRARFRASLVRSPLCAANSSVPVADHLPGPTLIVC